MNPSTLEKMKRLYQALYALSVGLQATHIKLAGEGFYSAHELLEEAYEETRELLDEVGERVDRSGGTLPATPSGVNLV